jgi:hypothetical protein
MLKNILVGIFTAVLVVAIGTAAYNVIGASAAEGSTYVSGNGNGNGGNGQGVTDGTGTGNSNGTGVSVLDIPASDLSEEEASALLFMREEEKLARDVYNKLYEIWGVETFTNIAASEQMHMDEIALLLTRYNLTDPAQTPGVFTDANLQALYESLIAQGSLSISDALKVGSAIEEIDILDLQTRLAQTDNADIQQVYTNLMNASYHHLGAFSTTLLNQTGETYVPQYLSADAYQSAMNNSAGHGNENSNGQHGANGTGTSQSATSSEIHGTVSAYEYGVLTLQSDDGQIVGVELGNQNYVASLGFAPQIGEGVTVYGFPGEQGLFTAITITLDGTGQVFTFRESTGRPTWAGGNGQGTGNGNHP